MLGCGIKRLNVKYIKRTFASIIIIIGTVWFYHFRRYNGIVVQTKNDLIYLHKMITKLSEIIEKLQYEIIDLKLTLGKTEKINLDAKFQALINIKSELSRISLKRNVMSYSKKNIINMEKIDPPTKIIQANLFSNIILNFSCPEVYNGPTYGYPTYKTGHIRQNCSRSSLIETVTIVLIQPQFQYSHNMTEELLEFKKKMKIKDMILVLELEHFGDLHKSVLFKHGIRLHSFINQTLGGILNFIITKIISTPYTLLAANIIIQQESIDIERLINVQELTSAHVIGTSSKYFTGAWNRGCFQSELKMYILRYIPGYFQSHHSCLHCDFTNSPFLAKTSYLEQFQFHEDFTGGMFEDFFLNIKYANHTLLVCPDVQFTVISRLPPPSSLLGFSKKWDIKKLIDIHDRTSWYGCRRGYAYTAKIRCPYFKGMAIPPCCLENLKDALVYIFYLCDIYNITCQLQEGSVLGAVKFSSVLPWELDADISILSQQFYQFVNLKAALQSRNYTLVIDEYPRAENKSFAPSNLEGGVLHIRADGWSIQVFAQKILSESMARFLLNGQWLNLPENPGLYVRNRYGYEVYKHAEHWITTGQLSGWKMYKSGQFSNCSKPDHHACLNHHIPDGNIAFG